MPATSDSYYKINIIPKGTKALPFGEESVADDVVRLLVTECAVVFRGTELLEMSELSKVLPEMEVLPCRALVHPWTDSCLLSTTSIFANSCVGSAGFYGIVYLCQYVSMAFKKKKKMALKDFLRMHLRSTIFGALLSTGTFGFHCLIRKLLGRYYYYTFVFLPASIAGLSVYFESRKGQELCTNAFANCALELWIRLLEQSKVLKWNANLQTAVFMLVSSLLSSLLSSTDFNLNCFWFFVPPRVGGSEDAEGECFHRGDCGRHIFNLFVMYSTTGFFVQLLRFFSKNFKSPRLLLSFLARPKAYKLAAFLGSYAVLYQAIRCYLYQKNKSYSLVHDSLAGFLAGAAFRFQPNVPILNSAVIATVQILAEASYRRKLLPNIPYLEIIFALLCGVLFHSRILLSENCPSLITYMTSAVTNGLSDFIAHNYKNILKAMISA